MTAHAVATVYRRPPDRLLQAIVSAADRDRTMRMLLELVRRAKEAGDLGVDFVLEEIIL